jgi:uncharacterized membrane protein YphA (DoxX/SURF4 family)
MNKILNRLLQKEEMVSAKSFAAFRIGLAAYLLVFISELVYFRPVIFNTIPDLSYNPFPAKLFLAIWLLAAGMLLIGWQTRIAAIVNYIFAVIATFSFSNSGCGSFNDDLLRIGSFLLIVMPVGQSFSIDAIIRNVRYGPMPSKQTSSLYYLAALFVSLGLMYFASSLTKLYSPMWGKGLGLWIPASMPYNKWHNLSFFLDSALLMQVTNYITVLWEFLFVFMLFSKKWRRLFALLGVVFHMVIALIFPFPLLCFGPVPFYFLFISDRFWHRFRQASFSITINDKNKRHVVLASAIQAMNRRAIVYKYHEPGILINHHSFSDDWQAAIAGLKRTLPGKLFAWLLRVQFVKLLAKAIVDDAIGIGAIKPAGLITPSFKRWALAVFCVMLGCVQLFYSSYHLVSRINGGVTVKELKNYYHIRKDIQDFSLKPSNLFRTLFGLNARGVFLDHSNMGTKTVFAVVYINHANDTTWLPFFDRNGLCLDMNMNLVWSKYSFNSVCSGSIPNPLELQKVLWFWAQEKAVDTDSLDLQVLKRTYVFPVQFEKGYYQHLASQPWEWEGTASWRNGKFLYRQVTITDSASSVADN